MIPESEWHWFGWPKHFIGANDCAFHMATKIGDVIVSTVGDYRPYDKFFDQKGNLLSQYETLRGIAKREPQEIGFRRFYETMTFKAIPARCDCCDWEIDPSTEGYGGQTSEFGYLTASEAEKGHLKVCYEIAEIIVPRET